MNESNNTQTGGNTDKNPSEEKETILIIDDEQNVLNIVSHILEEEGNYHVLATENPKKGIELARTEDVDLLLLDIQMPELDGYEVYERLRENDKTEPLPVIIMTARTVIEDTPKDFFYGIYGTVTKPFTKKELLGTVQETLEVVE